MRHRWFRHHCFVYNDQPNRWCEWWAFAWTDADTGAFCACRREDCVGGTAKNSEEGKEVELHRLDSSCCEMAFKTLSVWGVSGFLTISTRVLWIHISKVETQMPEFSCLLIYRMPQRRWWCSRGYLSSYKSKRGWASLQIEDEKEKKLSNFWRVTQQFSKWWLASSEFCWYHDKVKRYFTVNISGRWTVVFRLHFGGSINSYVG